MQVNDVVTVAFITADPRNNLRTNETYLTVERREGAAWRVVFDDSNWETKLV